MKIFARKTLKAQNLLPAFNWYCIPIFTYVYMIRRVVLPISYKKIHNLAYWNFYYDLKFYKVQVCTQKPYQYYVMRIIYFLFFYVLPEAISFISICYETLKWADMVVFHHYNWSKRLIWWQFPATTKLILLRLSILYSR